MRKTGSVIAAVLALASGASAQDNAAAEAERRLQLSAEKLGALYAEAANTHDGFLYTVDFARFSDCAGAEKLLAQLQAPPNRLRALRQVTKTFRYTNRMLLTMEPELREQVRVLRDRERTGAIPLASGDCIVAEVVESKQQVMQPFEQIRPFLALLVERGTLPHPDALESDPKLRMRTIANGLRTPEAVDGLPEAFDLNTRRSDGYTVLARAVLLGRTDIVRAALRRGASPNVCAPRFCPLELAIGLRDEGSAWEMLELLLQAGADPNQTDPAQRANLLPLAAAARKSLRFSERLVKAGAKVDGIPGAAPPLFFAAAAGKQDVVEFLLAQGADAFARDRSRPGGALNTAYVAAQQSKNPIFIEWMEKRMMDIAAKSGKYQCEVWLEQDGKRIPAKAGETRLSRAPFRVVARLPDGATAVLVASAQTAAFQDDVRAKSPESAIFRPATAGAEKNDGTSDWLYVLSPAVSTKTAVTQSWHWESDNERRFTGRRRAGDATEYYKEIRTIMLALPGDKTEDVPLARYGGGDIYLVVAVPVYLSLFDYRFIETHFLRLKFE